jgi:hypothetical protein
MSQRKALALPLHFTVRPQEWHHIFPVRLNWNWLAE